MILTFRKTFAMLLAFALLLAGLHIAPAEAAGAVRDGEFDVPFRYLKDGTSETSAANGFMVPNTGKLIIANGKAVFEHQVTRLNYSTFEYFGARKEGADKAVIANNTASGLDGYTAAVVQDAPTADNVVIQLEIANVFVNQDILMHINDKENVFGLPFVYNNWYHAQLELDLSNIDLTPLPVDKKPLADWIGEAQEWLAAAREAGYAESGAAAHPALDNVAITEGEFPVFASGNTLISAVSKVRASAAEAQAVIDDPNATSMDVVQLYNRVVQEHNWEQLNKEKYAASTAEIYVFESLDEPDDGVTFAPEIRRTVQLLQNQANLQTYANLSFEADDSGEWTPTSVAQATPAGSNGSYAKNYSTTPAKPVLLQSGGNVKVYQTLIRPATDGAVPWKGLWKLKYPVSFENGAAEDIPGVTKEVFISFNAAQHKALLALEQEARQLHNQAVEGSGQGQYRTGSKAELQSAIDASKSVSDNYASARADILAASAALQASIDTFKSAVNSGTPGTGNPGSPGNPGTPVAPQYPADGYYFMPFRVLKDGTDQTSIMNSYVVTNALVKVSGGTKTVSFTVKQSAEVVGLKLNGSSGTVTGRNTADNTRVVAFTLSNLSSKISGWVDVNWPAINYVHSYNIQFLFDESSASYAGDNPSVPGGGGNVGAPPGMGMDDVPGAGGSGGGQPAENEQPNDSEPSDNTDPESGNGSGPAEQSPEQPVSAAFTDLSGHWAKSGIEAAVKLGIVNGYSDGSFRPNATVSRGEFAVMLSRALQLEPQASSKTFNDSSSIPAWAEDHIARVVHAGLMGGFEDSTFRTNGQLTRAQLAVIIARAANLKLDGAAALSFADSTDIPAWARKEVAAAAAAGLVQGKNGRFAPHETATRAEALTLIIRLLDYLDQR